MVKIHTAKAGKDYPSASIKKGDRYYYWYFYKQPARMSLLYPRASETESNPTKAQLYHVTEKLMDQAEQSTTPEEIADAVIEAIEECDPIIEEFEEKAQNIEDGFGHEMPVCEELREWAEQVNEWKADLESMDINPDVDDEEFDLEDMVQSIPQWSGF